LCSVLRPRSAAIRDRLRINNRIRAREVRLIDDQGVQVGIVSIRDALQLAEERGMDLVEVAPTAVPPVCRLMDYGKFRYEQSKKEREARKNQRQAEIKEIRLKPKTDEHDLEVKGNQARRFLLRGDKVKFTVRFRGREIFHPDIGREMLDQLGETLQDVSIIEQRPLMEGRALSLVLAPNAKALKEAQRAQRAAAQRAEQQRQQAAQAGNDPARSNPAASAAEPDDDDLDDEDLDDDIDDDEDEEE
jgi:translation initiation factor IF-3